RCRHSFRRIPPLAVAKSPPPLAPPPPRARPARGAKHLCVLQLRATGDEARLPQPRPQRPRLRQDRFIVKAQLVPEEEDDLWHAYNLIVPGDTLQSVTVRKVLREMASGGRDAERVRLKLEIVVESVDYDKEGSVLRVRGKNITENDHVKIGQFHTVELELKRQFTLTKELWDWLALDTIQQACDPTASADLAVILMQEGLAHLFLIGRSITVTRARIETSIPRKHGPAIAGYESVWKLVLILCNLIVLSIPN
ncbi:Os04g0659900, partial [Oryza sativa Japonica Group]